MAYRGDESRKGGMTMGKVLPLLLVAGAGMLALSAVKGAKRAQAMQVAERTRVNRSAGPVRASGPEAMEFPPDRWDIVDEQSDQSFPASDAPGTY